EQKLLEQMGARVETPDSGCCGLAGSWGYEAEHYDVSMACGERVLLPAARAADPEAILVADGFSCRTQIAHGARRKALHLAQVIRLAQTGAVPEQPVGRSRRGSLALAGAAALVGGALLAARRR
ncbi:MAG TPA: hypothetical protein VGU26_10060, partial [Gaiellaceae bacterium]|nr:hypothetical protein [Gaiellaceae bacterium]